MIPDSMQTIRDNLDRVRRTISAAAQRTGRSAADVTLVAVTKYAEMESARALVNLGVVTLGESRPQQLVDRSSQLPNEIEWHLIGHLQRNKVRPVLQVATLIHSIDSMRLLERVNQIAQEIGITPRVLLEVNVSGEDVKDGFSAEDLLSAADQLASFEHARICGLMTMAPFSEDPESARPVFRRLRELQMELKPKLAGTHELKELSMGMSGDFHVAVEEGATLVRIGRTLYEGLDRPDKS
ncbi:MAG: YggS family pyridoxal phosphate-dependent enzyme [Planctomycetota bacterium]|nr:YggS family pyridoxal phosphate-dependent enzyme [Planctomycetota bacterium]